jgi:hypothetical protein
MESTPSINGVDVDGDRAVALSGIIILIQWILLTFTYYLVSSSRWITSK